MAGRVFLHVGTTKSGTTFLQRVLWSHRTELLERGVLLPGTGGPDHYAAALDVREEPFRLADPDVVPGAWGRLVDQIRVWSGDALVSHELWAPATAEQAAGAMKRLGDAEVHVVITARDLARQVPSEWQEHLKHKSTLSFPEFVAQVRSDPRGPFSPNGYWFWDEQDLPALVSRWNAATVHVVTVPRGAGPDVLWSRFTGALGIDASDFDLDAARSNTGLRAEQAELLRRLNVALGDRLPLPGSYTQAVKTVLANKVLNGRPGSTFGLTGDDHAYAVERARSMVAELEELGCDVVGDLSELIPDDEPRPGTSGDAAVSSDAVLGEAVEALAEVLERLATERGRTRRLRARLDR